MAKNFQPDNIISKSALANVLGVRLIEGPEYYSYQHQPGKDVDIHKMQSGSPPDEVISISLRRFADKSFELSTTKSYSIGIVNGGYVKYSHHMVHDGSKTVRYDRRGPRVYNVDKSNDMKVTELRGGTVPWKPTTSTFKNLYRSGKLRTKGRRSSELLVGSFLLGANKEFYKNGNKRQSLFYKKLSPKKSQAIGVVTNYDREGTPRSRTTVGLYGKAGWMISYEEGIINGATLIHNGDRRRSVRFHENNITALCHEDKLKAKKLISDGADIKEFDKKMVVSGMTRVAIADLYAKMKEEHNG